MIMNSNTKIGLYIIVFFIIGSSLTWTLTNYGHPYWPLTTPEFDKVLEMPEVKAFYDEHEVVRMKAYDHEIIDREKGIRSDDKFRLVFQAIDKGQFTDILEVYYFAWIPYVVT